MSRFSAIYRGEFVYSRLLPISLRSRLTILFTAGMVFFLVILNGFIYWATAQVLYRNENQLLQSKVHLIAGEVTDNLKEYPALDPASLRRLLGHFANEYQAISLLRSDGSEMITVVGPNLQKNRLRDYRKLFQPKSIFIAEKNVFIARQSIKLSSPISLIQVEIIEDAEPLKHFMHILFIILGTASIATLGIAGLGGYWLARIGLRPLNRLIADIRQMTATRLSERLAAPDTSSEITELVQSFNTLLDRIEEAMMRQKQFISDASHELRTPLSIIEGYTRLLDRWGKLKDEVRDESLKAMQQETRRIFRLVDDLLSLAKLEQVPFAPQSLDVQSLVPLLKEVKQSWESTFPSHLKLLCRWEEPLILPMDRERIRQLLDILLDNAKKYTDMGQVTLIAYSDQQWIHIQVEDTGIGIPEEDLPYIFERFYRVDKSRSRQRGGSGLGLAIAKLIVEGHGGEVTLQRASTGGVHVHVKLPVIHGTNSSLPEETRHSR
jgi:two-component system, OmpR family, sensor histidine kinase ArlS